MTNAPTRRRRRVAPLYSIGATTSDSLINNVQCVAGAANGFPASRLWHYCSSRCYFSEAMIENPANKVSHCSVKETDREPPLNQRAVIASLVVMTSCWIPQQRYCTHLADRRKTQMQYIYSLLRKLGEAFSSMDREKKRLLRKLTYPLQIQYMHGYIKDFIFTCSL